MTAIRTLQTVATVESDELPWSSISLFACH